MADLGFRGEVVDFYHRFRRGYPPAVIDSLVAAFDLSEHDIVVDIGCGTGQLTLPLARRVRASVGVDPSPDMLARARRAAAEHGVANVNWILGSDADLPALGMLLGPHTVGAATIGQALHWMDHEALFGNLARLIRPGGGVAMVANGTPLWLQHTEWSRALRRCLRQWLDAPLDHACGTDAAAQRRYRSALSAAGFGVRELSVDYVAELAVEEIIGGVYSALPVDRLPAPDQRSAFASQIRAAVTPHAPLREPVHVAIILGQPTEAG